MFNFARSLGRTRVASCGNKSPQTRPNFLPSLETLEGREPMAADIVASLSAGTLRIEGTPRQDTIIVRQIGDKISIDGVATYNRGSIHRIEIMGLDGNDRIRLDGNGTPNQSVGVASTVWGGNGDDLLVGGSSNDQLVGGNGADVLYGMIGDDMMWGEAGNDLLYGGAGQDQLMGGTGHDELLGETGNDKLWGGSGNDWLWGGSGNDYVDGGTNLDVAYGNSGSDTFANLNDVAFFFTDPHLKSPVRGVGDLNSYGIMDYSASQGDRK